MCRRTSRPCKRESTRPFRATRSECPRERTSFDDVYNNGSGARYGGLCTDQTGQNGNISADPFLFNSAPDFRLRPGSAAIDAADQPGPVDDFDGDARPIDGDGDGEAINDMGADEYVPRPVARMPKRAQRR